MLLFVVAALLAMTMVFASGCDKAAERLVGVDIADTTQVGSVEKPGATIAAISGEVGIRWPFWYSERPENWNGTDGNRTGGGLLSNPCGTGQMNSHSQADYYSRDLSRKSGSSQGVPVYAGRTGIVIFSGWSNGYGNTVVIWDPRENIQIRYAHLSEIGAWGGYIQEGWFVGRIGNTPGGFPSHLHLTVYKNIPLNNTTPAWTGNLCRPQTYACSYHFY